MEDEHEKHLDILQKTEQEIHALVKVLPSSPSWLLSAIYASPNLECRKILWNNLCSVASTFSFPWLCIGDFNEVLNSSEKFGGKGVNSKRISLFRDCINSLWPHGLGLCWG